MKHLLWLLLCGISLIVPASMANAQEPALRRDTVMIGKVKSGTVFTTTTGETISLLGVAAPKSPAITPEEARDHLELLLAEGRVILVADSLVPDRPTGLKPRYVSLLNGDMVNHRMIADGYASAAGQPEHSRLGEFKAAETAVRYLRLEEGEAVRTEAVQCSATTRKGTRCRKTTRNLNGRCHVHQ